MKTRKLKWTSALAILAVSTTLAFAAEPTLKVGGPAPKLQTGKWVQGEPVKTFEKDKAYIVEFWATWCGPCRESIPHLNEIYSKFKDKGLVVIGQDCWEGDESLVEPFVKSMGKKMTYRVALDSKEGDAKGWMAKNWMEAAGRNGIPTAYVVDKQGTIAWIGHPMGLKDQLIEDVLAGKFDVKKAAAEYETQRQNETQLRPAAMALSEAMREKNWDEAETKLAEVAKLVSDEQRDYLDVNRFVILIGKKDYPAAYQLAEKACDAHRDNMMLQNAFAWEIATNDGIEKRDLDLAEKLATRANEAAKGENSAVLDTLARVLFMKGKKSEAIALQEKAVKMADSHSRPNYQWALESYQSGTLPKVD